ncbi:hypothetical protein F896_02878 [Acinetobacter genomosp. 15BJ]|uniref:DUF968 domain-containing protein n=1 Tax=Acinetobacter genomosp. 15BJ TaxID=106651 RepID=R9AW48_9GAMM|nr:hypothetical protein F896_02878 [Acinetobacter genomosp. 15BJ]
MHSQKMLSEIKRLPCVICGNSSVEVAQNNQVDLLKESSTKASDFFTIPLCRNHHIEYDQFQKMNRSQSVEWFNQMLEKTEFMLVLKNLDDVF